MSTVIVNGQTYFVNYEKMQELLQWLQRNAVREEKTNPQNNQNLLLESPRRNY